MSNYVNKLPILVAEDDPDDRLLIEAAFEENGLSREVVFVADGEELTDYLCQQGRYSSLNVALPAIILLDLNMPRKSGRQALREIKSNPELRYIPVIVLTTSALEGDVRECYEQGASSFIQKPSSFEELKNIVAMLEKYWLSCVVLTSRRF